MRKQKTTLANDISDESASGTSGASGASGTSGAQTTSKRRHRSRRSRRRQRRPILLLAIVIILAGVILLAYPFAADYLNKVEQNKVAQTQEQIIAETPKEDLSSYLQAAQEYNERLLSGSTYVVDPFDPDAPKATDEEYVNSLNLNGDGVMGQIVIPKIGVDLPIYHGTEGEGMNHGVGHVVNTSLPVGGPSTHAVLAGHTGLPSAVIFDKLDQLEVGDYFIIQVLGEDLAYEVTSIEVVLPTETSSLAVQAGKDLVTLVTCTPYGVNSHRLLIHAERCEAPQEWLDRDKVDHSSLPSISTVDVSDWQRLTSSPTFVGVMIGLGVAAVLLVVSTIVRAIHRHIKRPQKVNVNANEPPPVGDECVDRRAGEAADKRGKSYDERPIPPEGYHGRR